MGDGCTGVPDKILWLNIKPYCDIHDEHYANKDVSKEEADLQFFENIKHDNGILGFIVAKVYFFGVEKLGWIGWNKEQTILQKIKSYIKGKWLNG